MYKYFTILTFFLISCNHEINETKVEKVLIHSLENSYKESFWLEDNLDIERQNLINLKRIPITHKKAKEFAPKFQLIDEICNETNHTLKILLNKLMLENGNQSIYEKEDDFYSKIKRNYPYEEIIRPLSSETSNKYFFKKLENEPSNSKKLNLLINSFREKILQTSLKLSKEKIEIKDIHLISYDSIRKALNKKRYPYTENIILIHERLTKPNNVMCNDKIISWEECKFKDVPLITCIEEINNLRKDVLITQKELFRILFEELHKSPLEINKVSTITYSDKTNAKQGDVVNLYIYPYIHDSTKVYPVSYKYSKQGKSNMSSYDNKIQLKTNKAGKYKIEGEILVEVDNILRAFPWEYQYEVK